MPAQPNILLLYGSDELAIQAHVKKLCQELGDAVTAEMNISHFTEQQGNFDEINTAVNSAPFLAPRRVVVLHEMLAHLRSEEDKQKYLELINDAMPSTTIVLVEGELKGEFKKEHWLLKWIKDNPDAESHLYELPKKWEMARWLESEAVKLGGKIDPGAAARLAELTGEDTRMAAMELTKLLTYVNFERPVNMADVDQVSLFSAQQSIFDLVDALGGGEGAKAQRVLHHLLEGQDAMELWGMIIRQFRLLLQMRDQMDAGKPLPEIQKTLGQHPYVAQKLNRQASRFKRETLVNIYHALLRMDEDNKTSRMPLEVALDGFVVELAGGHFLDITA